MIPARRRHRRPLCRNLETDEVGSEKMNVVREKGEKRF